MIRIVIDKKISSQCRRINSYKTFRCRNLAQNQSHPSSIKDLDNILAIGRVANTFLPKSLTRAFYFSFTNMNFQTNRSGLNRCQCLKSVPITLQISQFQYLNATLTLQLYNINEQNKHNQKFYQDTNQISTQT